MTKSRTDMRSCAGRQATSIQTRSIKIAVVCLLLCVITPLVAYADITRIHFNNQDLFLNGANLAWQYFANDIGPSTYSPDLAHF